MLGRIRAADRIQEDSWYEVVMRGLSQLSNQFAKELGEETQATYLKPNYVLGLEEAPPTRLLSLAILLSAWLGWVFEEKAPLPGSPLHPDDCLERLISAFEYGREVSRKNERP